ncbi:ankyrin repeat-containing domain protein [Aspergillus pseudoustus]|uniref:Ankyrin repeat-containing domain protein n=1 Tax=Aspergillus pseudoustus TaxID=1810923 RepID=A0ABR4JK63_9EURO
MRLLANLPFELLCMIAEDLRDNAHGLSAMVRSCRLFYTAFYADLYRAHAHKALFWAAENGVIETAKAALKYGADIHADCDGKSETYETGVPDIDLDSDGEINSPRLQRLLLENNFTIHDVRQLVSPTPVLVAVKAGHVDMVDLLLSQPGATVNLISPSGTSLLTEAVDKGQPRVVEYLLSRSDVKHTVNLQGHTPLAIAVHKVRNALDEHKWLAPPVEACITLLNVLLAHHKVEYTVCDSDERIYPWGFSILDRASLVDLNWLLWRIAQVGPLHTFSLLLTRSSRHVDHFRLDGRTLLSWVCAPPLRGDMHRKENVCEMIRILRARGADPNSRDDKGRTPLSHAAQADAQEAIEALISGGADVNAADDEGKTPLWHALPLNCERAIGQLRSAGAVIRRDSLPAHEFARMLWAVAEHGYAKVIQMLVAFGADPDSRHRDGRTALGVSAKNGHAPAVRVFLALSGVDVNARDAEGLCPLQHAVSGCHVGVVQLLVADARVDVTSRDEHGVGLLQQTSYEYMSDWTNRDSLADPKVLEHRLSILELLIPHPAVINAGVQALAEDILSHALRCNCLPLLEVIFRRWQGFIQPTKSILATVAAKASADVLENFLAQWNHVPTKTVLLIAGARNENDGKRVMQYLLHRSGNVEIRDEIVEAAFGNARFAADILDILLARRRHIPLTHEILRAAAATGVVDGVQFLLTRADNNPPCLRITSDVLECAAGNPTQGAEVVPFLLAKSRSAQQQEGGGGGEEINVTREAFTAAITNPRDSYTILAHLLRYWNKPDDESTTHHILQTLFERGGTAPAVIDFMVKHFNLNDPRTVEMVIECAAAAASSSSSSCANNGKAVMEYISSMDRVRLALTEKSLLTVMAHFEDRVILLLLTYHSSSPPSGRLLTQAVIEAAAGKERGTEMVRELLNRCKRNAVAVLEVEIGDEQRVYSKRLRKLRPSGRKILDLLRGRGFCRNA